MHELAGGLWTWTAPHPEWNGDPNWGPEVRSYALQTHAGVVLFDPSRRRRSCSRKTCEWP